MTKFSGRFESLIEQGGTRMVIDRTLCIPAVLGNVILHGQTRQRSIAACAVLKRIYSSGLDAISVRHGVSQRLAFAVAA
jgi:hypothetical protein